MGVIDFYGDGNYEPPDVINDPGRLNPNYDAGQPSYGVTDPSARGGDPFTSQLTDLYSRYGRGAPTQGEIDSNRGNPGGLAGIEAILKQDNAKAAAAQPQQQQTPQGGNYDDAGILAQIARWATMAGADPSLGNDPNYWLGAIKAKGGLNAGNLQYWQDAGVGPTAFFRNPNRESGGGSNPYASTGGNPGGYTDPSSQLYLSQLLQRLNQVQQPQDNSVYDLLKTLALQFSSKLQEAPYSAADEQALIARYREPLNQARDAAYQRNKEEASRKGYLPSSGLLRSMDSKVNQAYEGGIAQGANQMGVNAVQQKQQNMLQALQVLSGLNTATNQKVDRSNAMNDQAVALAKMFPDFDSQRLDQLLRASGDTSSSSALNSLMSLGNMNLNTQSLNNSNDQANSAAWGKLIAAILGGL